MAIRATAPPNRPAGPERAGRDGPGETFPALFGATCDQRADSTALIDGDVRLSFADWLERSESLAAAMHGLGIRPGDVVSFQLPNWWEAAVVFCATARIGAIVNPILPIFRERDLEFVLGQSESRLLFIPESFRDVDYPTLIDRIRPQTPALEHVIRVRDKAGTSFRSLLRATRPAPDQEIDPADLLLLMYTSGTTAAPKGVLHTHATLVSEVRSLRRVRSLTPADSTLMPSPLTHISGVLHGIMTPTILGTRAALMERWGATAAS